MEVVVSARLLEQLLHAPPWLVVSVAFALPALESSAFVGFVFPGETALLLGGAAASQGRVPLADVVAAGIAGAILGDAVGYLVGRRWGRRILDSTLGRLVNHRHLDRAERALVRRGGWAVFLGRFAAALRVMVPGLAGMAGMPYRRFLVSNVAGGVTWGILVGAAGYLAGTSWHAVERYVAGGGTALVVGVALLVLASGVIRRVLRRRAEEKSERRPAPGRA